MASLRTLRRRIKTSKNISQITRAMEMVAASKMKRAQEAATRGRIYSEELTKILNKLASNITANEHPMLQPGNPDGETGVLLLSTDKGLCGGLNTNLFLKVRRLQEQLADKVFKFVTVGKRGRDYVVKSGGNLWASFIELGDKPHPEVVRPIAKLLIDGFMSGELSEVWVVYPAFVSTLTQEPRYIKLLPIKDLDVPQTEKHTPLGKAEAPLPAQAGSQEGNKVGDYVFEPSADKILDWLLPYFVENRIYQLILEAKASEQSARMVSMKNAHDNAQELVGDLKLTYNRMRQARVTNELLDAIGSRMALA